MEALNLLSQRRSSRAAELAEPGPEGLFFNGFSRPVFAFLITVSLAPGAFWCFKGSTGPGPARGSRSVLRW